MKLPEKTLLSFVNEQLSIGKDPGSLFLVLDGENPCRKQEDRSCSSHLHLPQRWPRPLLILGHLFMSMSAKTSLSFSLPNCSPDMRYLNFCPHGCLFHSRKFIGALLSSFMLTLPAKGWLHPPNGWAKLCSPGLALSEQICGRNVQSRTSHHNVPAEG